MSIVQIAGGLLLCSILVTGCGREYDGRAQSYDFAGNPEGFPSAAVALVAGIETGQWTTAEEITLQFAELYPKHPELLGQETWREVVGRLGKRLKYRADSLTAAGIEQFAAAAEHYGAAAQMIPGDTALAESAMLFGAWKTAVADPDSEIRSLLMSRSGMLDATAKNRVFRDFALRSGPSFRFAREYLVGRLIDESDMASIRAEGGGLAEPADRAFYAAMGLDQWAEDTSVMQFERPSIKVPAIRLMSVAPDSFLVEVYLLPESAVSSDLRISFWVETPDPVLPSDKQPRFPFDFEPAIKSTDWAPGEIAAGVHRFSFAYPISAIHVGLYAMENGQSTYVPIAGETGDRARIAMSVDSAGI